MTNNTIIKEYAKNKLLAEQAQNRCKELQPLLYDIIVSDGTQDIGKKTYTVETAGYKVSMTEANSAVIIDYKAIALNALGMDEKQLKAYAEKHGYTTTRKGAITYRAFEKE